MRRFFDLFLAIALLIEVACSGPPAPPDSGDDPVPDAGMEDAGPVEPGCDPGSRRLAICGMCGERSELCSTSGEWVEDGPCLGEGECQAAVTEEEDTPTCGRQARLCSSSCEWGDWEAIVPDGECVPDETRQNDAECSPPTYIIERCSDSCAWQPLTDTCVDDCGGVPRTTPTDATELCIPAGPFYRGYVGVPDAEPVLEVTLSTYYIDRYPVTVERFQACVDAGACTRFDVTTGPHPFDVATYARRPAWGVSFADAEAFCAWDGGRRLPTEAEWEKAARGPSPRMQPYTWDGTAYRCDLLEDRTCGFSMAAGPFTPPDDVDAFPGARSYYGADLLIGGLEEWVSDGFDADYYADPTSTEDPTGPLVPGPYRITRGTLRSLVRGTFIEIMNVSRRDYTGVGVSGRTYYGVRCARSVL
jgi:formylglycine-generating enzyme required for sulfatase activity